MAKAEAAEQKALDAQDDIAREQAFRDAARQWERAADREKDGKRRQLYADKAEEARKQADTSSAQVDDRSTQSHAAVSVEQAITPARAADKKPRSELN